MDQLWAPWRLDYIKVSQHKRSSGCFLCIGWQARRDRDNLVVYRGDSTLVVLNRFPYNNGHLLIAPAAHKGEWAELTDQEMLELMQVTRLMIRTLDKVLKPDGYNVGLNLGRVAGAGLPDHIHWHVVPRWNGDTNFMPVVADTKVIVQSLDALYELVTAELGREGGS